MNDISPSDGAVLNYTLRLEIYEATPVLYNLDLV